MATADDALYHGGLDEHLVDDLDVPCDRLVHEGFAVLHLLDYAASVLSGDVDESSLAWVETYLRLARWPRCSAQRC